MAKNGPLRPEVVLTLGDRKIKLRATMAAIEAIERHRPIVEIYRRIREERPAFTDLATVVFEGARACNEDLDYAEAFELVQAEFLKCSLACLHFCATAFGPPPESAPSGPPQAV